MRTLGKIFANIYTIIFTILLLLVVLLLTLTSYLKGNFYTSLITSKDFMETKLSDISLDFDGKAEITELCGEDCTVKDAIMSVAHEEYGIKEELVEEALADKDIQKAAGEFASFYVDYVTTNESKEIDYKDYEKALEKEVMQKILKEVGYTKEDIKIVIDEYNQNLDKFNSNQNGGTINVQSRVTY